jgi:alpha-galactosidase
MYHKDVYVSLRRFFMNKRPILSTVCTPRPAIATSRLAPDEITDTNYMFPAFSNGEMLLNKKQGRLPAMGWNSWNAFGSKNTEELTKAMADAIVNLGLADLGYVYVVLDDGCYKSERVNGLLSNETMKFPSRFKALSDYMHSKGLKFGMYNDIGTNLCAGSAVGTCGYEDVDSKTYIDWGVDFLKVDNCYYLWDNATFSDSTNAKYTYAPNIRSITVSGKGFKKTLNAVKDGVLLGQGSSKSRGDYVTNIGTLDGTNVGTTPVGDRWSELEFTVNAPAAGDYGISVNYASGEIVGAGRWLQLAVGEAENETRYFDNLLPLTESTTTFTESEEITVSLNEGENIIRLMNHRRQENTLNSYAALVEGLNKADPDHDVLLSICEWGKTQPQNWGYKVGDSWRILNDITFSVGSIGNPGSAAWSSNNTASITSQYNKAVIMDEFAGLDKGWNDPDMLVIGMNGITNIMSKTHMTMWCLMNSPIMLGMDLRRVTKGDEFWQIIANKDVIALNQDALGIQAKRIYCSADNINPDRAYVTNNNRFDILAKPLANGDIALSFINLSGSRDTKEHSVDVSSIINYIGQKMVDADKFKNASSYHIKDLWTGEDKMNTSGTFTVTDIDAYDNVTIRVTPV